LFGVPVKLGKTASIIEISLTNEERAFAKKIAGAVQKLNSDILGI